MDIREQCIFSLFFHVIAVLLLAAVSQNHLSSPDALTVSLYSDNVGKASIAEKTKAGETRETAKSAIPAVEVKTASETAEGLAAPELTAEEKPAAGSEPEKATESPQTASGGSLPPTQEEIWLAHIHRVHMMHASVFMENASQNVQKALRKEIENDPSGALRDGTAEVIFYFNDQGDIGEIWGTSDSEKLESVLRGLNWRSIPVPADYRLRMRGLNIQIKIVQGEPSLLVSML